MVLRAGAGPTTAGLKPEDGGAEGTGPGLGNPRTECGAATGAADFTSCGWEGVVPNKE